MNAKEREKRYTNTDLCKCSKSSCFGIEAKEDRGRDPFDPTDTLLVEFYTPLFAKVLQLPHQECEVRVQCNLLEEATKCVMPKQNTVRKTQLLKAEVKESMCTNLTRSPCPK